MTKGVRIRGYFSSQKRSTSETVCETLYLLWVAFIRCNFRYGACLSNTVKLLVVLCTESLFFVAWNIIYSLAVKFLFLAVIWRSSSELNKHQISGPCKVNNKTFCYFFYLLQSWVLFFLIVRSYEYRSLFTAISTVGVSACTGFSQTTF